jgi:manganese transport protein
VILSLQLGFAVIPLIHFVSNKKTMGVFAISTTTKIFAWLVASALVYLNIKMVGEQAVDFFSTSNSLLWKSIIIIAVILFIALLIYSVIFPLLNKKEKSVSIQMHPDIVGLKDLDVPVYSKIAVALDFSENDAKLLASAIGQAKKDTQFLLIHVVESASAVLHGQETADYETQKDKEQLEFFVSQLNERGFDAIGELGFRNRVKEIVRIVKANEADMLVIGAHGHTAIKDFIYGETVNAVRHELKIPVLVINL